jgi:hypothetical protein
MYRQHIPVRIIVMFGMNDEMHQAVGQKINTQEHTADAKSHHK